MNLLSKTRLLSMTSKAWLARVLNHHLHVTPPSPIAPSSVVYILDLSLFTLLLLLLPEVTASLLPPSSPSPSPPPTHTPPAQQSMRTIVNGKIITGLFFCYNYSFFFSIIIIVLGLTAVKSLWIVNEKLIIIIIMCNHAYHSPPHHWTCSESSFSSSVVAVTSSLHTHRDTHTIIIHTDPKLRRLQIYLLGSHIP